MDEEKQADELLTNIAVSPINVTAEQETGDEQNQTVQQQSRKSVNRLMVDKSGQGQAYWSDFLFGYLKKNEKRKK